MVPDKQLSVCTPSKGHVQIAYPPTKIDARAGNRGDVNRPPERPQVCIFPPYLAQGTVQSAPLSAGLESGIWMLINHSGDCCTYVCSCQGRYA